MRLSVKFNMILTKKKEKSIFPTPTMLNLVYPEALVPPPSSGNWRRHYSLLWWDFRKKECLFSA